jgi:hypothetical protein
MSSDTSDNVCQDIQNWCYCYNRQCHGVSDITMTLFTVSGGKFVDIDNITLQNQRKKIQFTDNKRYRPTMGRKKKVKCELVMAMV